MYSNGATLGQQMLEMRYNALTNSGKLRSSICHTLKQYLLATLLMFYSVENINGVLC